MSSLVVVGAGPKAMALATKVTVLRENGFQVPHLHVVERQEVGAHWSGRHGYTDGRQMLGTPPEKDVGFPYQSDTWGDRSVAINQGMQRFSWQSFLAARGEYDDWVDRGKPSPCHGKWAAYLKWIAEQVGEGVTFHRGEVVRLRPEGAQWEISISGVNTALRAKGVVLTGPAKVRLPRNLPVHSRIFTIETFWLRFEEFRSVQGTVLLVGTGENAAVAAAVLSQHPQLRVKVLSPQGAIFSRGEGFTENRVYSRPDSVGWKHLSESDRREFIRRTDRGVFSVAAQQLLAQSRALEVVPGRLTGVREDGDGLLVESTYGTVKETLPVYSLVLATGSDMSAALAELLPEDTARLLPGTDETLEQRIGPGLEVEHFRPFLHLPMLSGLRQGPGFANLSCLGRLSDRILSPYMEEERREQTRRFA